MKPWVRKAALAFMAVFVLIFGLALWQPRYLFLAAVKVAPETTAKALAHWTVKRRDLIAGLSSPQEQKKNLEEQTIRIELGGRKYNIPIRYAYWEAYSKHGYWPKVKAGRTPVGALTLNVLLPDMKPYYPEDDARWKALGHGEKVDVTITSSFGPDDWFSWLRSLHFTGQEKEFRIRGEDIYHMAYFAGTGVLSDYFFPLDESLELFIACTGRTDTETPSPSCKVKSNYKLGIVLRYSYSKQYLYDWKQIDTDLKALFDHFEQVANATEALNKEK